jgi:hypothetical protein
MATNTQGQADQVARGLHTIKTRMPKLYEAIQARAVSEPAVYVLVRRGLRGEANCFYGCEAGHVVGTPFAGEAWVKTTSFLKEQAVQFGLGFLVMWGDGLAKEKSDGA